MSDMNHMNDKNPLEDLDLFRNVAPATLKSLNSCATIKTYKRSEQILQERVTSDNICILLSGNAFVYSLTNAGNRKIHFIFGPGALLNDTSVGRAASGSFCQAMDPCKVLCIPVKNFVRCMKEDFALTTALISAQEKKIWRLEHQQKNMASGIHLERKLAAKLWKLGRDFGVPFENGIAINLNLPVAFLADMLGVSRETASRLRSDLIRRGILSMNGKQIVITDPDRMSRFYKTGKF